MAKLRNMDVKQFGRVCQKAMDINDTELHKQVSYLHAMLTVSAALLAADEHLNRFFGATSKYADTKISPEHVGRFET